MKHTSRNDVCEYMCTHTYTHMHTHDMRHTLKRRYTHKAMSVYTHALDTHNNTAKHMKQSDTDACTFFNQLVLQVHACNHTHVYTHTRNTIHTLTSRVHAHPSPTCAYDSYSNAMRYDYMMYACTHVYTNTLVTPPPHVSPRVHLHM